MNENIIAKKNESLTWPEAYYPVEERWVDVEYALRVRADNDGEYRENPCVHSKAAWERGEGIQLTPVDNFLNDKVNFFRSFPGQRKLKENIAATVGVDPIYTDSGIRVSGMIDMLERVFQEELDIIGDMGILSVSVNRGAPNLLMPDITIRHNGQFGSKYKFRETRLFIRDHGRNPKFPHETDWILNIMKYEHSKVTTWIEWKIHFLKEWRRYRTRRENLSKPKVRSRKDAYSLSGITKLVSIAEIMAVNRGDLLSPQARWFW